MSRLRLASLSALACVSSSWLIPADAHACGGCFHPVEQAAEQTSVVTAHRMALSVSGAQSVLWDQVEYAGSPDEFAWVLPIKPGARIEVASDAWFETLEAATSTRVNPPPLACPEGGNGFGCTPVPVGCAGDSSEGARGDDVETDPVTVVHRGSAGPYETVTLHSDVPGALTTWLTDNSFAVDADIQPIIDAYADEGFDFIALRLLPDVGVQQMKPVRVVQPGAVATLPLRMVAAGTGANVALTLFVIGEGRWTTQNFPHAAVDPSSVTWDFDLAQSSYASLRESALAAGDGRSWLTSYARKGALLSAQLDGVTGAVVQYVTASNVTATIGEAFIDQALSNGETVSDVCVAQLRRLAMSADVVVDPCLHTASRAGHDCAEVLEGSIDARLLTCPPPTGGDVPLDDLAVAMTGMHPRDVWVTRLEANLPRAALADDLVLGASQDQGTVDHAILAGMALNEPCPLAAVTVAADGARRGKSGRNPLAALFFGVAIATIVGRRFARRPVVSQAKAR